MRFIFVVIAAAHILIPTNANVPPGFVDGNLCNRNCNGKKMNCYFEFQVETYYSMSKACYKCPEVLTDCFRMDCVVGGGLQRTVTVVNRKLPGPAIEVCEGDKIKVLIQNMISTGESTSIHWHGIHQQKTPYMDGVPFITQCPIPSNNNFTYDFPADLAGTHFWHSHTEMQRGDGAFGALIVRQQPRKNFHRKLYNFDLSEHVMFVNDWNDKPRMDVFQAWSQGGKDLFPTGILINGLGMQPNSNVTSTPLAKFTVRQGNTYRFRIINSNFFDCPLELTIDNHQMMVISSDGEDVQPVLVDSLGINGGERYDFIITANKPIKTYWIRVKGFLLCAGLNVFQLGVLQYEGTTQAIPPGPLPTYETANNATGIVLNPISKVDSKQPVVTIDQLRSIKPIEYGFTSTNYKKFFLTFDLNNINNPKYHRPPYYGFDQVPPNQQTLSTQLNDISFKTLDFPMLPDRYRLNEDEFCTAESMAKQNCSENYCTCTQVLQVNLGDVVEIILIELADQDAIALHPIHLHGFSFRVLTWHEIGSNLTRSEIMKNYPTYERNILDNPPLKDTVTVPRGGITIVRFVADNPGFWFLHCHIDNHAIEGMAAVLKVGDNDEMVDAPNGFPKCGNYPSTSGKSPSSSSSSSSSSDSRSE